MAATTLEAVWRPPQPLTVEDTGLRPDTFVQLVLKALHVAGELAATDLTDQIGVAFAVLESTLENLKNQQKIEIVGGTVLGSPSYRYRITMLGREHALAAFAANGYSGIAPVTLDDYRRYMESFVRKSRRRVAPLDVSEALGHLVLNHRVLDQIGPALNSGESVFIYGPPGNGKTAISQAIGRLLPGELWIPHAIEAGGAIIQVFDPTNHEPLSAPGRGEGLETASPYDRRWVRCRRPVIVVGAEMTRASLELAPGQASCRPPVQLLANGGALILDDFGRQKAEPRQILNRWIQPLETKVDYLTLPTGQKIDMPFAVLPVFATNIRPAELVDEAFLRRMPFKILVENPTGQQFARIFQNVCREQGLDFDPAIPRHIVDNVLVPRKIALHGCQPRDLISQALAYAQYFDAPRKLTIPLLDAACAAYFLDEDQGVSAGQ